MLTLDEIRRKKEEYHYTNAQLSKLSGVPLGTVQKVLGNVTKSPRYETLRALSAVFEGRTQNVPFSYQKYIEEQRERQELMLKEPEPAYGRVNPTIAVNWNTYDRQGTYTIDDYLALPDEQRVELIDGVIYDMGAPTSFHQLIAGDAFRQISNYIRANQGSCVPFIAPTDVQLDCDNRTMVQPDVLIVCDRSKINRLRVFGAPDFVLEVLSPSTKRKDIFVKGEKYRAAGVKEYWVVDPMKETVTTYDFRDPDDFEMKMYTFADKVPMILYDGNLVIDFAEMMDYYSDIPE